VIVSEKQSWLSILLSWRGTALKRIWLRVLFVTLVAVVVTVLHYMWPVHQDLTPVPFQLSGLALGIFLGFRNNTSYDRFWEGRRLWGAMVNTSRTFTRQLLTLVGPMSEAASKLTEGTRNPYATRTDEQQESVDDETAELLAFHKEMVHRTAAYVHCLRAHLRDQDGLHELRRLLPEAEVEALKGESNRPIALLQMLGDRLRDAWLRGWVHPQHLPSLDKSLSDMCDIQGGCERVKNTPIPFSYTALIHSLVALYCFALPFGLVEAIEYFTPIVTAIIAYSFFGLDAVGDEIEDPFGTDENDLPLTALTTMIEINIRQRIGDKRLPAMPKPIRGVLV
jgi:putative membrane protein